MYLRIATCLCIVLAVVTATGCRAQAPDPGASSQTSEERAATLKLHRQEVAGMKIWSPDFQYGQPIPARYACDGEDQAPALNWSGVPEQARSLALVMDDPDAPAGTWVHWLITGIPKGTTGIPEGGRLPTGAKAHETSNRQTRYGGPCPPSGTHRYFFRLYALDTPELPGLNRKNYPSELAKHALSQAEWMGTYRHKQ